MNMAEASRPDVVAAEMGAANVSAANVIAADMGGADLDASDVRVAVQMRRRVAIIADDFTGAADAAAPFADRGAEVSLVFAWPPRPDVEVLALVTDTRWRDERDAAAMVAETVGRARQWGADRLFVKVDSTLRGNVRAEVGAALAAWGTTDCVATPAFPGQGRVVRDGVLYVHDEARPRRVAEHFPPGVLVVDAETEEMLDEIARSVTLRGAVAVGSAGLARSIAGAHYPVTATDGAGQVRRRAIAKAAGVLVVVGTWHPVSRGQARVLVETGAVPVTAGQPAQAAVGDAARVLQAGGRVVLTTPAIDDIAPDSPAAAAMATELGEAVAAILAAAPTAALVMTGGATAYGIALALGMSEFRLVAEVEAGIAVGELVVSDRRIAAVTKSGGFGTEDALVRAVEILEGGA